MSKIIIEQYSPRWKEIFGEEASKLREIFVGQNLEIEHIGSTSIHGLDAKPIVDIMVGFQFLDKDMIVKKIESIGYEHWYEDIFRDTRLFFTKWDTDRKYRLVHIHATTIGSDFWNDQIVFRDKLRSDPLLAQRYVALKKDLAEMYGDDRDAYTEAKTKFVREVLSS